MVNDRERAAAMDEGEAERQARPDEALRDHIEVEAVGFVLAQMLRPVIMEPLPWTQVDLLRALRKSERPPLPVVPGAMP